ncbi:MAG: ABC transporter permease subunit, partial [Chloroflexota bacterium]|nr:ABC transporter permease subunit [Chloroflexota bacterium]
MLARGLNLAGRLPLLLLTALFAIPLGYLLLRALGGFEAGRALLRLRTLELIADTALLAVLVTVLSGVIGIALAWLVARADVRYARIWLLVLATPIVIPSYVSAFALIALFSPRGLIADPLTVLLGLERLPPVAGLPATVFAMTTICYPYVLLPTVEALHRTNFQLEEAARVLGKGRTETLRRILFPLVAPSAAAGALIVSLYSISDFGAVSLLDYDAISSAIYARYEYSLDRSAAAWFSLLLAAGALGLVLLELWVRNRRPVGWDAAATLRRPAPVPLGAWTLPAYVFMSLIVLSSLVLPLSMLGYWTVQGFRDGLDAAELGRQAGGTIAVALAAGGICALLAAPMSWLRLRRPGFLIRVVGSLAAVNYAIPGIALGLS